MSVEEIETRALPDGWTLTHVGEIAEIRLGKMLDKAKNQGDETPYLRNTNVRWFAFDLSDLSSMRVTIEERETFSVRNGDLFICEGGEPGRCAIWRGGGNDLIYQKALHRVRLHSSVLPEILLYWLKYQASNNDLEHAFTGTTIKHLTRESLSSYGIPLPPLNEQKRIVEKLEVLLSDLDAAVQSLTTALEKLKHYRRSVLKAAVEGELTQEWREANQATLEPASGLLTRILQERRERWEAEQQAKGRKNAVYEEPAAPDVSSLPELPEGWVWATVEQLGFVQLGRQRSPKNRSKDYSTKYVRAGNITENGWDLSSILEMEFEPHELETYRLHVGDILLSEASGSPDQVGKPAIWAGEIETCCFQNTLIRFRRILLSSEYPYLVFRHFYFNKVFVQISGGVGINHLSAYKFKSIAFPLPPLEEQAKIFQTAIDIFTNSDELEANIKTQLTQAEQTRQSVLEEAFSGKLVPQDPTDEPATLLLERIREEKIRASQEAKVKKPKSTKPKTQQTSEPTSLAETLRTAGKALTPEELFRAAGYTFETKEQFFQDVRDARAAGLIEEKRLSPSARDSLLSVSA